MQGDDPEACSPLYPELWDFSGCDLGAEGYGPHDVLPEDALVAIKDASKGVLGTASRKTLPLEVISRLSLERAGWLFAKKCSTNMHAIQVSQEQQETSDMRLITTVLLQDSVEAPVDMASTNLPGFTLGGKVDPLELGEATNDFILVLITKGLLKATSGVPQPWRLVVWIKEEVREQYTEFAEKIGVPVSTQTRIIDRLKDGSRLQVCVYHPARVFFLSLFF